MRTRSSYHVVAPFAAIGLIFLGIGCTGNAVDWPEKPGPKVIVSFAPLYCFALNVAGDDAAVKSIMSNQGPHHYETKLAEAVLLKRADLFFINGLGLDDKLAAKLTKAAANKNLKLIDLGSRVDKKFLVDGVCNHDHDHGAHDHDDLTDPHVWVGLNHAVTFVDAIRDELKHVDSANAANYDRRAAEYTTKLKKLQADGTAQLKDKKERQFVAYHGSLTYFAKSLGLETPEVIQKTPGKEPTAKDLEELIQTCKTNKIHVIAVEPQYSAQSSAKRLVEELKRRGIEAVLVEIDPLETANPSELTTDWYETKMRANIEALAKALK